ncbi:hypothetical protein ACWDG1_38390 [Streptomyces sp. NPDC001177]
MELPAAACGDALGFRSFSGSGSGSRLAAARGGRPNTATASPPRTPPTSGYKVCIWLKNARAAARKTMNIERRRTERLPAGSSADALTEEPRGQLDDIDLSWCPAWPVEWQRALHLTR